MRAALMECTPPDVAALVTEHRCFADACTLAQEDLAAFLAKDPAQQDSATAILHGSTSFRAVLHYRLAHSLIETADSDPRAPGELKTYASLVASRGKLLSGADIHPRCKIGRRFVLDHGWGSVIGETSLIGDDCYLLGGVTLGATGIADNPAGKRHPTIGDRVQIGAFARVFGDIRVGSDVFIGSHCSITHDIAPHSIVTLRSETQIVRSRNGASLSEPSHNVI
ncbi:serine O-acetyltransferase [Paraburkholderia sp. D15]|uniref:serine O-acetyltransferase n=1 Tax=Paraburkholderia sp. D15 TaxID=2880218 RepID=UPI002479A184|nr:serine O-acetyltransferase [Paraburkholderia sp. D15]WGS50536.1 serine O-acetyltransferase [Paraburkholderia sp. D15]